MAKEIDTERAVKDFIFEFDVLVVSSKPNVGGCSMGFNMHMASFCTSLVFPSGGAVAIQDAY